MKKTKIVVLLLAALLIAFFSLFVFNSASDTFSLREGRIFYPQIRPIPSFNMSIWNDSADALVYEIDYQSHGAVIPGLLRIPKNVQNPPVVVILPGATVTKEGRQPFAQWLASKGYASFVIDERGNGQTPKKSTLDQDYSLFVEGREFEDAEMVLDALKAVDVTRQFPVDSTRIVLLGESMGGRYGIIAASLDPKIKGLVLISSAGFGLPSGSDARQTAYFRAVDPDHYIDRIAPRPVYFIHSPTDAVIPIGQSRATFDRAGNPKGFSEIDCAHGYCEKMNPIILEDLRKILGK